MSILAHAPLPDVRPSAPRLPDAVGPLSARVANLLAGGSAVRSIASIPDAGSGHPHDHDAQLALWMLNISAVSDFAGVEADRIDSLPARTLHWQLEGSLAAHLHELVPRRGNVALGEHLDRLIDRPGILASELDAAAVQASFVAKAPYLGWEADPHTMALSRVEQELKPHLAEIQAGEYGVGHAKTHAQIYRGCLAALDVDLIDAVAGAPACSLAFANAAWLFGGHRHLRGASVGQLCLLELDSVEPCRRQQAAWDAAGLPEAPRRWYDVHALADVEHAEIIAERMVPTIQEQTPWLVADAAWGAEVTWMLQTCVAQACQRGTGHR